MTLPSSNSQSFQVLLDFAANTEVYDRIEKATAHIVDETERAKEMTRLYGEELKKTNPELYKQIQAEKEAAEAQEKLTAAMKKQNAEVSAQIRNLRAQAREITTTVRLLRDSADDIDRFAKPLALLGGATVGGIFAFANKYVKDAEQATQTTREWKAAQDDLNRSGQRIGEVLATEALPLLKQAADVTRQVAGFIEAHPEVVKIALTAGTAALAIGTLGKAVSSGIRLYADLKLDAAMALQLTAAELQVKASENQLKAAGIQAAGGGGGQGGIVSQAKNFAPLAGPIGAGVLFSSAIFAGIIKMDLAISNTIKELTGVETPLLKFSNYLKELRGDFEKTADAARHVRPQEFLGGSKEKQDQIVQVFGDWQKEDAKIVNDAMEKRKQIVADGEKQIADITRNFVTQRANIERQYAQAAQSITAQYLKDTAKAEADYIKERAQLIKDGEQRIRDIRAQEQEKLEQIERDFAKNAAKATAERDALALVRAQEARDEAIAQATGGTSEAIAKEKRETAERLQELAARYAAERAQREQQYQEDLKENAKRRAEALKQAEIQHQEELKQARALQAEKLKELDREAQAERLRRREQAIAQLQDLGLVLNNERQLRANAYNAILGDLQTWLNNMRASFGTSASTLGTASGGVATTSTTQTATLATNPNFISGFWGSMFGAHDYTGYAYPGIYRMAVNGQREWVVSGKDTQAAERAIGGQLTQDSFMQMISLFGQMKGAMTYNDQRNFNSGISARQRRDIANDTRDVIEKMLGAY